MKEIILSEMKNTSILPNIPVYQLAMEVTGDAKSAVVPEISYPGRRIRLPWIPSEAPPFLPS
ncbi:hypothetical protein [Paenibacillus sp. MMO-58]|uniref:hypothetical protein n=1 Tax=Paenibacillus sp. MMO-58 TaxID=3081290 RepID=UPI00301659CE